MAIEHVNITEANLHELKGASTALVDTIPVADGAGSHTWKILSAHSAFYYDDIGTGTTITTPTSYTLIGPATVGEATPKEFTHNSLGRLTYTGTATADIWIDTVITLKHSVGSGQDCFFQIHKNGVAVAGSQTVTTADSGNYTNASIAGEIDAVATNDYFEVFCKVASGSIVVHALNMRVQGQE
jgi:hypothetical protein